MGKAAVTPTEVREFDGVQYLNARHLITRIRELAQENRDHAIALGEDLHGDDYVTAVSFHAAALRFDELADRLDLAIIEQLSNETP